MLKESKKLLLIGLLILSSSFSVAHADSALIPGGYWEQLLQQGGLFGNITKTGGFFGGGGTTDRLIPNCSYQNEYNPYTQQYTQNEVCNPRVASYTTNNTGNYYNNVPDYSYYTYYTQPATRYVTYEQYQQPQYYDIYTTTYTNNQSALSYYSGSNIWYPCDRSGYCDEGLFNTYYRDGRGDVTGFYDDPNLCFHGGSNCGGTYNGLDGLVYYPNDNRQTFCDAYGCYQNIAI